MKERLIGFEIITNKGQIKKFGYGDDSQLITIPELENKENVVVGFEISADDKDGITGMCCYYLPKNKYMTFIHSGFFYLKAKLRNKDYKKKIEGKIQKLDRKFQILYQTCLLPDYQFLQVMRFVNKILINKKNILIISQIIINENIIDLIIFIWNKIFDLFLK